MHCKISANPCMGRCRYSRLSGYSSHLGMCSITVIMSALWPFAQHGITWLAFAIKGAGPVGIAVYSFLERVLIPTGLHHLVYTPFLYTELGGTAEVCGKLYQGDRNLYFAEMACGRQTAEFHRNLGCVSVSTKYKNKTRKSHGVAASSGRKPYRANHAARQSNSG